MDHAEDSPLFCHRCGAHLTPGRGNFYVARIEAMADPTPPELSREDLDVADLDEAFRKTLEEMRGMSEQELMDQVYRRLTIHLCGPCYRIWIDNPTA